MSKANRRSGSSWFRYGYAYSTQASTQRNAAGEQIPLFLVREAIPKIGGSSRIVRFASGVNLQSTHPFQTRSKSLTPHAGSLINTIWHKSR